MSDSTNRPEAYSTNRPEAYATLLDRLDVTSDQYASMLFERVLAMAAGRGASDIHLDALPGAFHLRIRIDGKLHSIGVLPNGTSTNLTVRIKSLSGLLTYRTDIPQEGRLTFGSPRREARVVTFPTLHGERTVIRMVAQQASAWQLSDLGMTAEQQARHEQALSMPSGVVVISGPVGSGKTTTAYAALRWLAGAQGRCVVTLEDPIESELPGVAQAQVDAHVGFDWNSGLRSLLRQDPEVIFIGEIRDSITAQLAFRASMSGQLVVTTLHARTLSEAFLRLLDMQVPSQHLISGLRLLSNQRLVARECGCGEGCPQCDYTGHRGRALHVQWLPELRGELARVVVSGCDAKTMEEAVHRAAVTSTELP